MAIPPHMLTEIERNADAVTARRAAGTAEATATQRYYRTRAGAGPGLTRSAALRPTKRVCAALRRWLAARHLQPTRPEPQRAILDGRSNTSAADDLQARLEGWAATGDAAVDEAYTGFGQCHRFLAEVLDRNSIDGAGAKLEGVTHFGRCNTSEAPVWMGDYTFKPIGAVEPGDTVIGWEKRAGSRAETGQQRNYLCSSHVLGKSRRHAEVVRITTESGRVIRCTPDHPWLAHYSSYRNSRQPDANYRPAEVGKALTHVIDPVEPLTTLEDAQAAGYLGGIYDGEGYGVTISQYKEHNPEITWRIKTVLDQMGFPYSTMGNGKGIVLTGDDPLSHHTRKQYLVNFINWCQPAKINDGLERTLLGASWGNPDRVVSIEPDGEDEVVSLQTSTGNYVAWGFASKNCYLNAFWDGSAVSFGDGDGQLFTRFTASLSIVGHELIGHGLVQHTSPLRYEDQSGALNEHVADVMGALLQQRARALDPGGEEGWLIGAELLAPGVRGRALRSMLRPGSAYSDSVLGDDPQPGHMADYVHTREDNGGVHINSGIPNRAAALAAGEAGAPAWETIGPVWFAVLTRGDLPPDVGFVGFARRTVDEAIAFGGADLASAVRRGWERVGIEAEPR